MTSTIKQLIYKKSRWMVGIVVVYGLMVGSLLTFRYNTYRQLKNVWTKSYTYEVAETDGMQYDKRVAQVPFMTQEVYRVHRLSLYFKEAYVKDLKIRPIKSTALDLEEQLYKATYKIEYTATEQAHHQLISRLMEMPYIMIHQLGCKKQHNQVESTLVLAMVYRNASSH